MIRNIFKRYSKFLNKFDFSHIVFFYTVLLLMQTFVLMMYSYFAAIGAQTYVNVNPSQFLLISACFDFMNFVGLIIIYIGCIFLFMALAKWFIDINIKKEKDVL